MKTGPWSSSTLYNKRASNKVRKEITATILESYFFQNLKVYTNAKWVTYFHSHIDAKYILCVCFTDYPLDGSPDHFPKGSNKCAFIYLQRKNKFEQNRTKECYYDHHWYKNHSKTKNSCQLYERAVLFWMAYKINYFPPFSSVCVHSEKTHSSQVHKNTFRKHMPDLS